MAVSDELRTRVQPFVAKYGTRLKFDMNMFEELTDVELIYAMSAKINEAVCFDNETREMMEQVQEEWAEFEEEFETNLSQTVESELEKMDESGKFDEIVSETVVKIDKYHVGADHTYKTIQSAVNAAMANQGGEIVIHEGTYDEVIMMNGNNPNNYPLTFVGTSKASVWKSTTWGYNKACFTGTGPYTFENLTIIKGSEGASGSGTGGYALHFDEIGKTGNVTVSNCTCISYENAAVGCGTAQDVSLSFIDNVFITYAPASLVDNGAFLFHSNATAGVTGQMLTLIGNKMLGYGENAKGCIIIMATNDTYEMHPIFINNVTLGSIWGTNSYLLNSNNVTTTNNTKSWVLEKSRCFGNNWANMNATGWFGPTMCDLDGMGLLAGLTDYQDFNSIQRMGGNKLGFNLHLNADYTAKIYNDFENLGNMGYFSSNVNQTEKKALGGTYAYSTNATDLFSEYCLGPLAVITGNATASVFEGLTLSYKPKNTVYCVAHNATQNNTCYVTLNKDGSVVTSTTTKTDNLYLNVVYIW